MTTNNNPPQPDVVGVPELLPCPLGHRIDKGLNVSSSSGMRKWHIWCFDCGLQFEGMLDETARELFARWNTRATQPATAPDGALLTTLEAAANYICRAKSDYYPEDVRDTIIKALTYHINHTATPTDVAERSRRANRDGE